MRGIRHTKAWVAAGLVAAVFIGGCGKNASSPDKTEARPSPTLSIANPQTPADAPPAPNLCQTFAEAVSLDSPGNQQPPADRTMAGLSTGKLRMDVQKLWDTIRFTAADGKPIIFRAVFDTEQGSFTVQLLPEVAPNHVRNFVCLAKCGYYNGLVFEHVIREGGDAGPESLVELVEGGCPVGTGEPGIGHLGYWLKPEFTDGLAHEPGVFGAFHDDSPETAACRFYVTLTKAPDMDGNFTAYGRVVTGLEVLRTIAKQPVVDDSIQPVKPVVIRSVTIETAEVK